MIGEGGECAPRGGMQSARARGGSEANAGERGGYRNVCGMPMERERGAAAADRRLYFWR